MYLDEEDGLLQIVRKPTMMKVQGSDKRIIPFSPPDIGGKEIGEAVEALSSGWITTGPRTKLLERRLAAYIETGRTDIDTEKEPEKWSNRVVCLNSATASEELNLRILGVGPGDEVIVPAYTYTASASAAIHCGAKVVFVDIQKDGDKTTHCPEMDYDALEKAITEKTKAISLWISAASYAIMSAYLISSSGRKHCLRLLKATVLPLAICPHGSRRRWAAWLSWRTAHTALAQAA